MVITLNFRLGVLLAAVVLLPVGAAVARGQEFGSTGITITKRPNTTVPKPTTATPVRNRRHSARPVVTRNPPVVSAATKQAAQLMQAEEAFKKGVESFDKQDYPQAIESFRQAVTLKPDMADAHAYLANAYEESTKDWDKAAASYKTALGYKRDDPELYYDLGVVYFQMNKYSDAATAFNEAIKLKSDYGDAYFYLASSYNKLGRWNETIEANKKLLELSPDKFTELTINSGETYYQLGQIYEKIGNAPKAAEAYEQAIKLKQDYAEAYEDLGFAYYKLQRWADAARAFGELTKLRKEDGTAFYYLGAVLVEQDKYLEASEAYKQALRFKEDDSETLLNLGYLYTNMSKHQEAIEVYNRAANLKADSIEARVGLGRSLFNKALGISGEASVDLFKSAIIPLKQAITLEPTNAEAHYLLGRTYAELGRAQKDPQMFEQATEACKEAVRLKPDSGYAHYWLGFVYKATGRLSDAIAMLSKAIALPDLEEPTKSRAHYNLGESYFLSGDVAKAEEQYGILKTLNPARADTFLKLVLKKTSP